jgi:hypothetical protein
MSMALIDVVDDTYNTFIKRLDTNDYDQSAFSVVGTRTEPSVPAGSTRAMYDAMRFILPTGAADRETINIYFYCDNPTNISWHMPNTNNPDYVANGHADAQDWLSTPDITKLSPDVTVFCFRHLLSVIINGDKAPGTVIDGYLHTRTSFGMAETVFVKWDEDNVSKYIYGQVTDNITGNPVYNATVAATRL